MQKTTLAALALAGFTITANAQKRHEQMDYGRFLTASWDNTKGQNTLKGDGCTANKGVAIKLGNNEGAMLFDTDLCRWAGGWTGGYVSYRGVVFDGGHGPNPAPAKGSVVLFETNPRPTWSNAGKFDEPRKLPVGPGAAAVPFGPLPREWARYRGLFLSGDNVVVSYTVGAASLLEMPALEKVDGVAVLTRTTNVLTAGAASSNIVWEGAGSAEVKDGVVVIAEGDNRTVIAGIGLPAGAKFSVNGQRAVLDAGPFAAGAAWKIGYTKGAAADEAKLIAAAKGAAKAADLREFTKGGAPHWKETVKTAMKAGTAGAQDSYVVDTIEVPFENPYKSWMRIGAFDFMSDGRMAVSTWSGDVWMVGGVNKDFTGEVTWQRVATGIFQALGLKVVNDKIYVHGREGITRLNDLNGDGEMDFYENFNNDIQTTPGFHEFAFDLQTDSKGNFYFGKGGPVNPGGRGFQPLSEHAGCIMKLSADGQTLERFATGVRAPNGISVGPGDVVTTGDNEGSWVPMSYVHIVKPGEFVTVASLAHQEPAPKDYGRHVCFLPKDVDNSGGGQAWVSGGKWGLPDGTMLHLSYGTCSLYGVLREEVSGVPQGGVYKFPLRFESGTMRGRFNPADGQLYISGLKGWQSSAAKDGSLQRVRYTGKPVSFPGAMHVKATGIELAFPQPLHASAAEAGSYGVRHWDYKWTSAYGSGSHKPAGGDAKLTSVKLSDDRKRVFLEIENLQPVMQMEIRLNIKMEDGTPVPNRIISTINAVPKP